MKKILLSIISLCLLCSTSFAYDKQEVKSKITEATVFLQGAQINRTANVNIPSGTSELVFNGVSPHLNTNSIKAGGTGNFIIMGVRFNNEYVPPGTKKQDVVPKSIKQKITQISDSLVEINFLIEKLSYKQSAWNKEKNMLENNQAMHTDSLPMFMSAMEFYRLKIHEINEGLMDAKRQLYLANLQKTKLNTRLQELITYKSNLESENIVAAKSLYQIIVTVSAKYATTATVDIDYFVNNASWYASYDLRAKNSTSPINITYKAHITQNTGEDWENVNLTLSTMNPNLSNAKPVLNTWYLQYYVNQIMRSTGGAPQSNIAMSVSENKASKESMDMERDQLSQVSSAYTQQVNNMANVEFNIDLKYTIPSDGKAHQVAIMDEEVASTYEHYVVPKVSQEAYLTALVSGWEDLSLLAKSANIYFMNTYVGSTYIDPNTIEDTLNLTLGRDKSIAVTREKVKDEVDTKIIGQNKEKTISIKITIRNKKNEAVKITVEDQIPVSREEDIKVSFDENKFDGSLYDKDTGKLEWELELSARETKTIEFTYKIKYPKNKKIQ